jgi:hypothetical protein
MLRWFLILGYDVSFFALIVDKLVLLLAAEKG